MAERFTLDEKWPGLVEAGNLDINNRPSVQNPDGGQSSVYSMSVGFDDGEYLIPRVSEDGRLLSEDEAVQAFKASGRHLGKFQSPEQATQYAEALHKQQAAKGNISFKQSFERAISHPKWGELDDDAKLRVVNRLMDADETTAPLRPEQRQQFMSKVIDYYKAQAPKETTFAEDVKASPFLTLTGMNRYVDPEGATGAVLNAVGNFPMLGPALTGGISGAANMTSGMIGGASEALRALDEGSASGLEGVDAITDYTTALQHLTRTIPSTGVSGADVDIGEEGWVRRAADWFGGGVGQTLGYVAPAAVVSVATGGAGALPAFAAGLTGEQRMENLEEYGELGNPFINMLSGTGQAVIERLVGPESLIGKNIFRDGIRKAIGNSMGRFSTRVAGNVVGEAATEGFQEYMNQQVAEWGSGDRGWWDNLEPEDKQAVYEGIMLGGAVGGMFAVLPSAGQTLAGDKWDAWVDRIKSIEGLTPEERGALGFVETPRRLRGEATEEQAASLLTQELLKLGLTPEQVTQLVNDPNSISGFDEAMQAQISEAMQRATEAAAPEVDESVTPMEMTEEMRPHVEQLQAQAAKLAEDVEAEGRPQVAQMIRDAAANIELVDSNSFAARTMKGFAKRFGFDIQFFRAPNGELIGSDGVYVGNGKIMVRWDATMPEILSGVVLHEVVHGVGDRNFDAMKALYNAVKAWKPEEVAKTEASVREGYAKRGVGVVSDRDMIHEVVSYLAQHNHKAFFQAIQRAGGELDVRQARGPLGRVFDKIVDVVRKATRHSKALKLAFGELPEAGDRANQVEAARLAGRFLDFLEGGIDIPESAEQARAETAARVEAATPEPTITDTGVPTPEGPRILPDNFGRQGRKKLSIDEAPAPAPREPRILLDEPGPREPRILLDRGKKAATRQVTPLGTLPESQRREPTILEDTDDQLKQADLIEVEEEPEVTVRSQANIFERPRTPRITLDEDTVTRVTAGKLERGDVIEVDGEQQTITDTEKVGSKYKVSYVDADGNVSSVTVGSTKRFDRVDRPAEPGTQRTLDEAASVEPEQQRLFEEEVEALENDETFRNSFKVTRLPVLDNWALNEPALMSYASRLDSEGQMRFATIVDEVSNWRGAHPAGRFAYLMEDESGLRGFAVMRPRFIGTPDSELYVDYIISIFNKDGSYATTEEEMYQSIGAEKLMAMREGLREQFPSLAFIGGYRIGGVRSRDPKYTRVPLWAPPDRASLNWWTDEHTKEAKFGTPKNPKEYFSSKGYKDIYLTETPQQLMDKLKSIAEAEAPISDMVEYQRPWDADRQFEPEQEQSTGDERQATVEHNADQSILRNSFTHINLLKQGVTEEDMRISELRRAFRETIRQTSDRFRELAGIETTRREIEVMENAELDALYEEFLKARTEREQGAEAPQIPEQLGLPYHSFSAIPGKTIHEYTSEDWNKLGEQYGVKNLGGMSDLVEIHDGVLIPGGTEGTFTYEELLWLKHMAINTHQLPREVHLELHRKMVRTLQPEEKDTLQILNNFIFSMLSPNQPLTPNELAYAMVRIRNEEEVNEWAQRIPWDAPSGEEPSPEILERDPNKDEASRYILEAWNNPKAKPKVERPKVKSADKVFWVDPAAFRKYYRAYYNNKIAEEFSLQGREKGGLGLLGTAELSNIAELVQFYKIDPDWFLMQETDVDEGGATSWHTYVERLATQFRGMATKVASFAAVWLDPLGAAISAIDRHMGRQFESELFRTQRERLKWEKDVIKRWNASDDAKKQGKIKPVIENGEITNFDELFMMPSGDGFFVDEVMKKIGATSAVLFEKPSEKRPKNTYQRKPPATFKDWSKEKQSAWTERETERAERALTEWKAQQAAKVLQRNKKLPAHWRQWAGNFISLSEDRGVSIMSDNYRKALEYNAEQAQELGLGLFASQWFLWDRYRRRLEPHEIIFPGLYKLPHMTVEEMAATRQGYADAGYLALDKEQVQVLDQEGRPTDSVEILMKPVKTAPLGSLNYSSFSEGPGHFPPGEGLRTPLYSMQQVAPLAVTPHSGPSWQLPEETWLSWLRRKVQDRFFRFRELRDVIEAKYGTMADSMDVYALEMLYHGRAADQIGKFEKEFVDPLLDVLKKNKTDIAEFEDYLHARHAGERNDYYNEVWYTRRKDQLEAEIIRIKDDIAYAKSQDIDTTILKRRLYNRERALAALKPNERHAGMTTKEAADKLKAYGSKFDEEAKAFDAMMKRKLEILLEGELITQEEYDNVNRYKHYVPLKGKEFEGDLEDILDAAGISTGRGFDIRGDELGRSFGRVGDDVHTHPILSQAIVDIEEAIIRSEKNRVSQGLLELVTQFPNEDLYEVDRVVKRAIWDKNTKTARLIKDAFANREDNVVTVKKDGEEHYIYLKDARLASAMRNLGSDPMHWAVKIFAGINRAMAALNTTLNPEFMVANFVRDVQTAGLNLSTEQLKKLKGDALKGIPAALNAIRRAEFGEHESDADVKLYREFQEEGGQIGFFGYTDVYSKARSIQRKVERAGSMKSVPISVVMGTADVISRANTVVENGTRLSVYLAARKNGMSKQRAAVIARNITVNFNKKGEIGQTMNAIWLFSNASIQGSARMLSAVTRSPRLQKIVAAQVMGSFAIAALNRATGGEDDEDGTPYWEKIGDWQKERNIVLLMPEGNGQHIKLPLPYGYNVFHVLGTELEQIWHHTAQGTLTAGQASKSAANLFNAFISAFNPLGGTSLDTKWTSLRFMVPSVLAPVADTLVNETYYGAPIQPVRSSWDHSPKSERYFKSVSELSKELTAYLNRWTGGNEFQSGALDINPEILDYLAGSYAGAGAKTGARVLFTDIPWLLKALSGADTTKYEADDIAFLRRVYGEINDNTVSAVFYENVEGIKQAEQAYKNLTGKQLERFKERDGWMIPLFEKLKQAEKDIRATEDADAKNRARKRFNRYYREAWLSQF